MVNSVSHGSGCLNCNWVSPSSNIWRGPPPPHVTLYFQPGIVTSLSGTGTERVQYIIIGYSKAPKTVASLEQQYCLENGLHYSLRGDGFAAVAAAIRLSIRLCARVGWIGECLGNINIFACHSLLEALISLKHKRSRVILNGGSMLYDSLLGPFSFHFLCDFHSQGKVEFKDVSNLSSSSRRIFARHMPPSPPPLPRLPAHS